MKVKDLKKLLKGVDDEMDVLIPLNGEFDGFFKSPCIEESGVNELGIGDEEDNETEKSFILVPCGFFDHAEGPDPELN
jgi:hypothetical protein